MQPHQARIASAIALLLTSVLFLMANYDVIRLGAVRPWAPLSLGILVAVAALALRWHWLLPPGLLLISMGAAYLFFHLEWLDKRAWWPLWLATPGIGLFLSWALGRPYNAWAALPGAYLFAISLVLFAFTIGDGQSWAMHLWPLFFAAIGLPVLVTALVEPGGAPEPQAETTPQEDRDVVG